MRQISKSEQFIDNLETMLNANKTVWVTTHEEERFINSLRELAPKYSDLGPEFRVLVWSTTEHLMDYTNNLIKKSNGAYSKPVECHFSKDVADPTLPGKTIAQRIAIDSFEHLGNYIKYQAPKTLIIVKDIHHVLDSRLGNYHTQVRRIRDIIQEIRTKSTWVIFLSTENSIPNDLSKEISELDMPLPDSIEISVLLDSALASFAKTKSVKISQSLKDTMIFNLLGLTKIEITEILTYTFVKNSGINEESLEDIKSAKRQIIEKAGYLEFIEPKNVKIGGHDKFKEYIQERGLYLDLKFREKFNLTPPKGVCLVGPPGVGKSIFAKYVGQEWRLPLMRLDMGAIYGEKLGQSEGRLRDALRIVEANAPCVLWIDEIEKAVGGINTSDSGTTLRIFGKLLTWMAERKEMVFMYCTANNLAALPPEFQRAGRLDGIWWADLPSVEECKHIFQIHCELNNIILGEPELNVISSAAFNKNMTGAEIQQAVLNAAYKSAWKSFKENKMIPVDGSLMMKALEEIRTYSASNHQHLAESRKQALTKFEFTSNESKKNIANSP